MDNFQRQFILALMAYTSKRDIDPSLACLHSGINLQALSSDTNVTISGHNMESLWKNLVTLSKDPFFGLHFGESMQLAALGIIGQIIQTSRNVGEALTTAGTLIGLVTNMFSLQIERGSKSFTIHLIPDKKQKEEFPFTYRQMADYLMVFIIHELDGLLLKKISPLAVTFPYDVSDQKEVSRTMRCDVKKSSELSIELKNTYLTEVIISSNYDLQRHLLNSIKSLLDARRDTNDFSSKLFSYLLTNSYLGDISLESTASNFNMSTRTLQRRLREEGMNFQQIADEVRRDLAVSYLSSGNYQVKDIAYMLGYKEQTALIRAFKRWTGKTPGDYMNVSRNAAEG